MDQQQNEADEGDLKPLAFRLKNMNWLIRKRAYEEILEAVSKLKTLKDQITINNQSFTIAKFTSFLNNLIDEKHPNVLLKGLECAEAILRKDSKTGKLFNKLVVEGLERFPLLTQQRKIVLEKFLEILQLCKIQSSTLSNRLNLPQEKSVMFVIEVIGALEMSSLKGKLLEISKKHPKKDVKELAAQIAEELEGEEPVKEREQETKYKGSSSRGIPTSKREEPKKVFRMQLVEKLPQFEQLNAKQQQQYSDELSAAIDDISPLPASGTLANFCYYIQLMVESNNQIISTNGVKMLTTLVKNKSQLINSSFPLLFLFRKFKTHKTHATNANLLNLVEALLCSSRSSDLMSAVQEGIGCQQKKANLKYGCIVSFIRIFCYYYRQPELFSIYCIGEYIDLYDKIENKRVVEKMLAKCLETFSKQKDKDKQYAPAIEQMRSILGMTFSTTLPSQKSTKQISRNDNKSPLMRNKSNVQNIKVQQNQKSNLISTKISSKASLILSPEGELGKILDLLETSKYTESSLQKALNKCLQCAKATLQQNLFDIFYYCQIADSFIEKYHSNEQTDEVISHFLIDYLKILSTTQVKPSKKGSKITETGLQYLLKLSTSKLVLSKQLLLILNNLNACFGFDMIVRCLGSLFVLGAQVPKKKNKKYLMRWLEENASEECVNIQYFEVIEAIENNGEKKKLEKKSNLQGPPSIINLPSYKVTPPVEVRIEQKRQPLKLPPPVQRKEETKFIKNKVEPISPLKLKSDKDQFQILQNADISKIEQVEEPSTDRLDEKWEYFLNKKEAYNQNHRQIVKKEVSSEQQQEKYNFSQGSFNEEQNLKNIKRQQQDFNMIDHRNPLSEQNQKTQQFQCYSQHIAYEPNEFRNLKETNQPVGKAFIEQDDNDEQDREQEEEPEYSQEQHEQMHHQSQQKQQQFEYKYLNFQKINYMIHNSTNPFNHLRTLILIPFKSQQNKHHFLRELTYIIQNQTLNKPQPFNSILLIIILLFTQIKTDKTIIEPLQFLYEHMAQHCTNNEFLKIIISLYHSVIDQTQQTQRKLLLTILTKSMTRIMPFVENALELLKDLQQFYQIGEMVYFQMFSEEYNQIRQVIEHSDSLEEVIHKAFEEEGESLLAIVEGWLETGFKGTVKATLETWMEDEDEDGN